MNKNELNGDVFERLMHGKIKGNALKISNLISPCV